MERYVGKVAIVTGASSGIGRSIAETLTKSGMKVVGLDLDRRVRYAQDSAEELAKSGAKGKLYAVKCDLCVEEDIINAFHWTTKNVGNVHVLVNNAAYASRTNENLMTASTDEWRKVLDTNILGLCIATREACKIMQANKIEGHIIHINSIVGHSHVYFPGIDLYGATKHAITNLTDILRQEMVALKTNIKVSSISPGPVDTPMIDMTHASDEMKKIFAVMMEPQDVADAAVYVLSVPRRVHINDIIMRPIGCCI